MPLAGLVSLVAELQPLEAVLELACTLPVLVILVILRQLADDLHQRHLD